MSVCWNLSSVAIDRLLHPMPPQVHHQHCSGQWQGRMVAKAAAAFFSTIPALSWEEFLPMLPPPSSPHNLYFASFIQTHLLNLCMHFSQMWLFNCICICIIKCISVISPISSSAVFICTLLPLLLDGSWTSLVHLWHLWLGSTTSRTLKDLLPPPLTTRIYTLNTDNTEGPTHYIEISSKKLTDFREHNCGDVEDVDLFLFAGAAWVTLVVLWKLLMEVLLMRWRGATPAKQRFLHKYEQFLLLVSTTFENQPS